METSKWSLCVRFVTIYWPSLVMVLTPLIFFPVMAVNDYAQEFRVMWLLMTMAIYWVTEALPLAITSTMPIVFLPLMGVMTTEEVTMQYWRETTVMLLGSIFVAIAIECSQLHKRIAFVTIIVVGCSLRRIIFSVMLVTFFISMWISNTAAAAMMLPIGRALLSAVEEKGFCKMYNERPADDPDAHPSPRGVSNAMFLSIMYASTLGGCCTIIGTGTNLALVGTVLSHFPGCEELDFLSFMCYATPVMVLMLVFTFLWIQVLHLGMFRPNSDSYKEIQIGAEGNEVLKASIHQSYAELGRMSSHEIWVSLLFVLAIGLWVFREPGFMPGWPTLFVSGRGVKDSTATFIVVLLMFIIPNKWSWLNSLSSDPDKLPKKPSPGLITWKLLNDQVPWNLMFLLGSGFAMSAAGKRSGMNDVIANKLSGLDSLPAVAILFVCVAICQLFTEFSSNVAIANITLPILASLSAIIRINPLFLMVPAGLGCSMAFNTPVGTPPNAIIYQQAFVRTQTMVKTGCLMSLIMLVLLCGSFPTYGALIFDKVNDFPEWAEPKEVKNEG